LHREMMIAVSFLCPHTFFASLVCLGLAALLKSCLLRSFRGALTLRIRALRSLLATLGCEADLPVQDCSLTKTRYGCFETILFAEHRSDGNFALGAVGFLSGTGWALRFQPSSVSGLE
jgi:hypothetical protein